MNSGKWFGTTRGNALLVMTAAALATASAPAIAEEAFAPRPQGGIQGALLPSERSLWTYDVGEREIRRRRRAMPRPNMCRTSASRRSR